ncbi:MAG: hypothetical protein JO015_17375 [Verrucomicrobia bacterium]|nr:hypothetical protein [Verrucomicrobiota bacterium]
MHETLEPTDHTQTATTVALALEVEADLNVYSSTGQGPPPKSRIPRRWHELSSLRRDGGHDPG